MDMTPDRWEHLKEVFEGALERDARARALFLDDACAGDAALRAEIEALLASYDGAGRFLAAPAFEPPVDLLAHDHADPMVGRAIGPYRTIREIGHGGMGAVYLAVRADEEYRKQVAIKVVKRGMDTDAIVRAFRKERQVLASLDHPNLARLLDGGTTDEGVPYFVMEYVEGLPLDVYCDTSKLPIVERLHLFRAACSAVHDAHQHGVIHRDLKPGNILVTAGGVPKLLDFGIAKVLNPELASATLAGTTIARPLTPAYASPEQIRGEDITPSSDVYALGVLLYELLTGHRPYRLTSHTRQELERVICEQEPEKPSTIVSRTEETPLAGDGGPVTVTPASVSDARADQPGKLRHRLAGDLDTIVLTALRKDPQRRYSSVAQLSEDIRRHLESRPITARKDARAYRTAKFVRRNRASVITGALSVVLVLVLLGVGFHPFPPRAQALAVLPFEPLVADVRDEYLEVGLADALITKLGNIPQLNVRPTEQVLKYRGSGWDPRVAARELGVETLLVGGVQRSGDRFRLSLKLVRARDGGVMWARNFDEPWTNIFAVETTIAAQVTDALALRLTGAERDARSKHDTDNPAAYREYLLGRHFWKQRTAEGFKRGLQHFERAVALDSRYALAQAGVAESYTMMASYRAVPPREAYPKARAAALEALELHPALGGAHETLGIVGLYYDWDWPAAERAFKRGIELEPDNAQAHFSYALALTWFSRFDEASREMLRAQQLDPASPPIHANAAQIPYYARRYDQAIDAARRALALDPNFWQAHQRLGLPYVQTGEYDRAIASFEKAIELAGGASNEVEADLAHAYAVAGRQAKRARS